MGCVDLGRGRAGLRENEAHQGTKNILNLTLGSPKWIVGDAIREGCEDEVPAERVGNF